MFGVVTCRIRTSTVKHMLLYRGSYSQGRASSLLRNVEHTVFLLGFTVYFLFHIMASFILLTALLLGSSYAQAGTEISSQNLSCPQYSSQFLAPNSNSLNITGRARLENLTAIDENGYVSISTSNKLTSLTKKLRSIEVSAPFSTYTSKVPRLSEPPSSPIPHKLSTISCSA